MIIKTFDNNEGTCHEWDDFTADETNGFDFPTGGAGKLNVCEETCWNLKYNESNGGGGAPWPVNVSNITGEQMKSFLNSINRISSTEQVAMEVHFNCVTMCVT